MKKALTTVAMASLLLFSGCGSDDTNDDELLEHDSVEITQLENKVVHYDSNGATHSYKYCPGGKLYYGSDLKEEGTFKIEGNNVVIKEKQKDVTYETDGKFEKDKEYTDSISGGKYKVTKITDTVCGM